MLINTTDNNDRITKNEEKSSIPSNLLISQEDDILLNKTIQVILPNSSQNKIIESFINVLELSVHEKKMNYINFEINYYFDQNNLVDIVNEKAFPGTIFIGPFSSSDTKLIQELCQKNILFFSFASERDLGKNCIFLFNFFLEDDLLALFNYFQINSKVALLYPRNQYGLYVNNIIDKISQKSNSIIVNKVSYEEDLSNARNAIKNLSKYDLRQKELQRQKRMLETQNNDFAKLALKKLNKLETIGDLDFNYLIVPDGNLRLLEIAPLLPFYDIDPDIVQFVGMGTWDDANFFIEPSLQGAIFPGVSVNKRKTFIEKYNLIYDSNPLRTSTIIYDIVGLIDYVYSKNLSYSSTIKLLNDNSYNYDGIDGKFVIENNLVKRKMDILKINDGTANKIN